MAKPKRPRDVNQLAKLYQFTIGSRIVRVKKSPRGHMKKCYVDDFLDAMVDLGFYEE